MNSVNKIFFRRNKTARHFCGETQLEMVNFQKKQGFLNN